MIFSGIGLRFACAPEQLNCFQVKEVISNCIFCWCNYFYCLLLSNGGARTSLISFRFIWFDRRHATSLHV